MISAPAIAALALTVAVSYGLYEVKYEVQRLEREYAGLSRELLQEQDAVHVLKAEWSYLSRPERVHDLARRFLNVQPVTSRQIVHLGDLPIRRQEKLDAVGAGGPALATPLDRPEQVPASAESQTPVTGLLGRRGGP